MNNTIELQATTWKIDPDHTQVEFVVNHMMFAKVRGRFAVLSGEIKNGKDGSLTTGQFSAQIETKSIDTSQAQRDEHLRSGDFFDVENFPHMTFQSTNIKRVSDDSLEVRGDLTIRDITREVVLDVQETGTGIDPWGNQRIGLHATTSIDRSEFGLTWNQALEAGGLLVGDEVKIALEVQAIFQEA